jgi:hypothetical protein
LVIPTREGGFSELDALALHVAQITRASRAAEVFKGLLLGSRLAAPRAAVFLVRRGEAQGWGATGYEPSILPRQRAYCAPLGQGWLGALVAGPEDDVNSRRSAGGEPEFGQGAAAEAYGRAVRVQGKPIAVIIAERSAGEMRWFPEVLDVLVTVGGLRLELDVALRHRGTAATEPRPSPLPALADVVIDPTPATIEIAAAAPSALDKDPALEAARRYARLVATDIRLYNEESVVLGRRNGDLLDRLADQLGRGKDTFLRRHGDLGPTGLAVLHEAYVQVLAGGDGSLIPSSSLD